MKKGLAWPVGIAVTIALWIAFDLVVVYLAASDPSFAVEPDYYRKGVEWDKTVAQAQANLALGWSLGLRLDPAGPGSVRAILDLKDASGAPLEGAVISVEAFHNARAGQILKASFSPAEGGYAALLPIRRPGLWEFRFQAARGRDFFTCVLQRELGAR